MLNEFRRRLLGVALRAGALGSKFLLVFFLAKFLPPEQVGSYGLVAAAVGYGIYLVGLEFYTYSSRELIGSTQLEQAVVLKNQFVIYFVWYLLSVPLLYLLARFAIVPPAYVAWIAGLLIFEHLAQELNRVLIALAQQVFAGVVLFVRMGAWGLVVILAQSLLPHTRNLPFVLAIWLAGSALACLLAVWRVRQLVPVWSHASFNPSWIARGLAVAFPLLIASIAMRGMGTFDRYFVETVSGLQVLGAYVLFAGMSSAVMSFLDAAVVDFAYPRLLGAARTGDFPLLRAHLFRTGRSIAALACVLSVACAAAGTVFVGFLDTPIYTDNVSLLYWLLLATFISACSTVPHLGLYAMGVDRAIVSSQVLGFAVFIMGALLLPPSLGLVRILLALCLGNVVILLWKGVAYRGAYAAAVRTGKATHD